VTLGLRYTVDRKRLTEQFQTRGGACDKAQAAYSTLANALGANGANSTVGGLCQTMMNPQFDAYRFVQRKSEGQLSGTVKTSYRFTPDTMAYASYAHGYKAGGFNMDRVQKRTVTASGPVYTPYGESAFAPEKTDSYELGTKLQLLNRSLAVNLTGFYQTFDDFQLNAYLGSSFTVKSMPRVISHGADLDVFWQTPVTGLFVQGGLTYAETRYGSFRPADAEFAPPPPGAVVGGALHRLPGSRLSFAPKYSSTFAVTYEHALAYGWTARPSTQVKYSSGYNTGSDLSPMKYQKGFALVDARLILAAPEDRYAVELWANNLFDRDYKQVGYNPTLQGGETDAPNLRTYGAFLGAPRTFGVTLRAKW
jgi:outer membrane receptor protein involved in Fe transport